MSDVYVPSYVDNLRTRLRAALGYCGCCGRATSPLTKETAAQMRVSYTTLWRFLKGGKPSADVLDHFISWLDEDEDQGVEP